MVEFEVIITAIVGYFAWKEGDRRVDGSDGLPGVDYRGKTRLVATSSEKIEATTISGARENGWTV